MVVSMNGGPKKRHPDTSLLIAGTPPKNGTSGLETSHVGPKNLFIHYSLMGAGAAEIIPRACLGDVVRRL